MAILQSYPKRVCVYHMKFCYTNKLDLTYFLAELHVSHLLDFCDGFCHRLHPVVVYELPDDLFAPPLGDHSVHAVISPGAPHSLLLGNLVGEQPVPHHQVAFLDVESFFCHTGGDQEVEGTIAEISDCVFLLILNRTDNTRKHKHRNRKWIGDDGQRSSERTVVDRNR